MPNLQAGRTEEHTPNNEDLGSVLEAILGELGNHKGQDRCQGLGLAHYTLDVHALCLPRVR